MQVRVLDLGCTSAEPEHTLGDRRADLQVDLTLLCLLQTAPPEGLARLNRWRAALLAGGHAFAVIRQPTPAAQQQSIDQAIDQAVQQALEPHFKATSRSGGWRHFCGRCGDGECEQRLFQALRLRRASSNTSCDAGVPR